MVDVLTILATVKTATAAIKSGIAVAKDLSAIAHDLSVVMEGVGKLTHAANVPRGWRRRGSAESEAIAAFAAREEAAEAEREVRSLIVSTYGLAAWESIQRSVIDIRKRQKEEAALYAQRRAEDLERYAILTLVTVLTLMLLVILYAAATIFLKR